MSVLAILLATQIVLGGLDNLWHHEIKERLPGRPEARGEIALHSARELCYALLFAGLAWWEWRLLLARRFRSCGAADLRSAPGLLSAAACVLRAASGGLLSRAIRICCAPLLSASPPLGIAQARH